MPSDNPTPGTTTPDALASIADLAATVAERDAEIERLRKWLKRIAAHGNPLMPVREWAGSALRDDEPGKVSFGV